MRIVVIGERIIYRSLSIEADRLGIPYREAKHFFKEGSAVWKKLINVITSKI